MRDPGVGITLKDLPLKSFLAHGFLLSENLAKPPDSISIGFMKLGLTLLNIGPHHKWSIG